jgi:hypothetical protein
MRTDKKNVLIVGLLGILVAGPAAGAEFKPLPMNPRQGMQKREASRMVRDSLRRD